jgi:hypothetical protein
MPEFIQENWFIDFGHLMMLRTDSRSIRARIAASLRSSQ